VNYTVKKPPKSRGFGVVLVDGSTLACDVQRYCSCSCRLWRYISVMPSPFTFTSHPAYQTLFIRRNFVVHTSRCVLVVNLQHQETNVRSITKFKPDVCAINSHKHKLHYFHYRHKHCSKKRVQLYKINRKNHSENRI